MPPNDFYLDTHMKIAGMTMTMTAIVYLDVQGLNYGYLSNNVLEQ